jgi:hypothetical protein
MSKTDARKVSVLPACAKDDGLAIFVHADAPVYRCVRKGKVYISGKGVTMDHLCYFREIGGDGQDEDAVEIALVSAKGKFTRVPPVVMNKLFGANEPREADWATAKLEGTTLPKYPPAARMHWEAASRKKSSKRRKVDGVITTMSEVREATVAIDKELDAYRAAKKLKNK